MVLRKLDCYRLENSDLCSTDIGTAVATLASHHPKPEVSRLALSILQKWRSLTEDVSFLPIEGYNIDEASKAPEGESVAPEVLIAAEKARLRQEKLERRRMRLLEQDFLATSSESEEDEKRKNIDKDEDWEPMGKITTLVTLMPPRTRFRRRSRSGRQRQLELKLKARTWPGNDPALLDTQSDTAGDSTREDDLREENDQPKNEADDAIVVDLTDKALPPGAQSSADDVPTDVGNDVTPDACVSQQDVGEQQVASSSDPDLVVSPIEDILEERDTKAAMERTTDASDDGKKRLKSTKRGENVPNGIRKYLIFGM